MYAEIFGRHFRPTFRFGTTSCTDCFDNTAGTKIKVFMNHPIDSLMIESGQLFELEGERRGNPYMDTPTIQVIQKAGLEPVTSSEYKYSFLLNHNTCPVWREIFGIHVLSPEVKFEGNKMSFKCEPQSLAADYAHVKAGIKATNEGYAKERESLLPLVEKVEKIRADKISEEEQRLAKIQQGYENLAL
jgi:hypothetical protein